MPLCTYDAVYSRTLPREEVVRLVDCETFYTVGEAASMLRLSRMTIYRLIHDGRLPAIQIGRSFRIPESSFEGMLTDSKVLP